MDDDIFSRIRKGRIIYADDPDRAVFGRELDRVYALRLKYNTEIMTREERRRLLCRITGSEVDSSVRVVPPFTFDLGFNIKFGRKVFVNYNCVFLDNAEINLGEGVALGPCVKLITPTHPTDPNIRREGLHTCSLPIHIEDYAWIGAGATILQGITVGHDSVVGAGAVVTRDVLPETIVAGVPAHVIRKIPLHGGPASEWDGS